MARAGGEGIVISWTIFWEIMGGVINRTTYFRYKCSVMLINNKHRRATVLIAFRDINVSDNSLAAVQLYLRYERRTFTPKLCWNTRSICIAIMLEPREGLFQFCFMNEMVAERMSGETFRLQHSFPESSFCGQIISFSTFNSLLNR